MNKNIIFAVIIILVILGGTYWVFGSDSSKIDLPTNQMPAVTSGENPTSGGIHDLPVEPAASVARKDLATKLSMDEKSIVILQITDREWSDGCLGLGKANESCLQALVPGFRVEMLANGKSYFYRTDIAGNSIRIETE